MGEPGAVNASASASNPFRQIIHLNAYDYLDCHLIGHYVLLRPRLARSAGEEPGSKVAGREPGKTATGENAMSHMARPDAVQEIAGAYSNPT